VSPKGRGCDLEKEVALAPEVRGASTDAPIFRAQAKVVAPSFV
jgi:hypothetical protein